MDHSTPGLSVHHQLPEFTQTHVHQVSDAIQPSHLLSSPFPPALNLSQHQDLFKWVSSSHQVAKVWLWPNYLLYCLPYLLIWYIYLPPSPSSPFQVLPLHDLELSWCNQQMNPSPQPLSQHCPSTRALGVYDGHNWQGNMRMTSQMPPTACTSLLLQKHISGQSPALAVYSIMCLSCVFPEELNTSGENVHTLPGNRTLQ